MVAGRLVAAHFRGLLRIFADLRKSIVGYDRRLRVSVLCLGATRRRPASSRFSDVVSDTYLLLLSMADNLIG